jgi:hypothetical protein
MIVYYTFYPPSPAVANLIMTVWLGDVIQSLILPAILHFIGWSLVEPDLMPQSTILPL